MKKSPGLFLALLVAGMLGSGPGAATTTSTAISGTHGITEQGCLQYLVILVSSGENCMYNGGPSQNPAAQPFGEVIGPIAQVAYYDAVATPAATVAGYVRTPGDGKIQQVISGTVTVDDAGTAGSSGDDLISFTITLRSPGTGNVVRNLGVGVVDQYSSMTQVLAPRMVDSATANDLGGFDYVIGSAGFPGILTFSIEGPCVGQPFGSVDCEFSFSSRVREPDRWAGTSAAGLSSLEGNLGARTVGTVQNLTCADTGPLPAGNNDCLDGKVSYNPWVNGPCATPGDCTGNESQPGSDRGGAEDVGWDQLLLKVSTNASGTIISVAGFNVEEYPVFGPNRCGDNVTPDTEDPGTYSTVCNSWISGYFTLGDSGGGSANDDGPIGAPDGVPVLIDVLANDTGFDDPVTVTVSIQPVKGLAVVSGSPGSQSGVVITYTAETGATGTDSFVYTVTDGTSSDTATVTLNTSPVASDGTITISTAGKAPTGVAGTFTAPGPGGNLNSEPGAPSTVSIAAQGSKGTATVAGTVITYTITDPAFFTGTDAFTYTITDSAGETDSGIVTVNVPGVAPTIADGTLYVAEGQISFAYKPVIVYGNGAPDQHSLTVAGGTNGTCTVSPQNGEGRLSYLPDPDFLGTDSCQLTVTDAAGQSASAVITLQVDPVVGVTPDVGGAGMDPWSLAILGLLPFLCNRRRSPAAVRGALAILLAAGLISGVTPGVAVAQEEKPANEVMPEIAGAEGEKTQEEAMPDVVGGVPEIVVTSRKIEEKLAEVPLAITAFDSNQIEAAGIRSLNDIAQLTPGLTFFNPIGASLPVPIIRGVVPTDIFGQPSAAVFVDEVFISGREGLNFSQLEVADIEVVKGPQSALYGRNAFSGAVIFSTKKPAEQFGAKFRTEIGNDNKLLTSARITGPILGNELRGSFSALYDDWDGAYNNPISSNDVGGHRYKSYIASLLWTPVEEVELALNYYLSRDHIDDTAIVSLPANCENRVDGDGNVRLLNFCGRVPDLKDIPASTGNDSVAKVEQATGNHRDLDRITFRADWDLAEFGSITSVTGYSDTTFDGATDFSRNLGENQSFLYCNGATVPTGGAPNSCGTNPANERFFTGVYDREQQDTTEEYSQEIRWASDQDQRARYLTGAYYYTTSVTDGFGGVIATRPLPTPNPGPAIGLPPFDPSAPNFAIGTAIFANTFLPDGGLDPYNRDEEKNDTDGWALFGAVDYDLTDRLTGRVELRQGQEAQTGTLYAYQKCKDSDPACIDDIYDLRAKAPLRLNAAGECVVNGLVAQPDQCTAKGSARFTQTTGRLSLKYQINDIWMVYGSIANGEKPGGLQLVGVTELPPGESPVSTVITNPFDPEKITAYELGTKGAFLDGRIRIDASVYYNDWTNIVLRQLLEADPNTGLTFDQAYAFNVNAGDASVYGTEVTLDFAITDNLFARATGSWVDSTLDNAAQDTYESFPTYYPTGDVSGNALLRQPEWQWSGSLRYERPLNAEWDWYLNGDASYQSSVYVGNDNESWLPAHTYVNSKLGITSGRYTIEIWGRNIFNDDSPVAAFRDIYFTNTADQYAPYSPQPARPDFNQFVPFRYSVSYPDLRTYGISLEVRFGGQEK